MHKPIPLKISFKHSVLFFPIAKLLIHLKWTASSLGRVLTKVSDATLAVLIHQDVLALQISMSDGRLALCTEDLNVQVRQAAGDGQGHPQAGRGIQRAQLQIIIQRAHLMVMCDQPQLSAGVTRRHVGCNKACKKTERNKDLY